MKKSYADLCLERAEKTDCEYDFPNSTVVELARRLKRACEALRGAALFKNNLGSISLSLEELADELQEIPEEK